MDAYPLPRARIVHAIRPRAAKPWRDETGCGKSACPDPGEPRRNNPRGPPAADKPVGRRAPSVPCSLAPVVGTDTELASPEGVGSRAGASNEGNLSWAYCACCPRSAARSRGGGRARLDKILVVGSLVTGLIPSPVLVAAPARLTLRNEEGSALGVRGVAFLVFVLCAPGASRTGAREVHGESTYQ